MNPQDGFFYADTFFMIGQAIESLSSASANEFSIAGKTLSQIKAMLGHSPFYAYDRAHLTTQVADLRAHLPEKIKLHYAVKANPNTAVVSHLAGLVDGFDVASKNELLLTLQTQIAPKDISFAGPGKTDDELIAAIVAGIKLIVESPNELRRAAKIAKTFSLPVNIVVRINPKFELKSSGMKMAGSAQQFGIDEEQLSDLLTEIKKLPVKFWGFHIFAGSQNLRAEALIEAHNAVFELLDKYLTDEFAIRFVNIGGGLGIPYFPNEQALDILPVMKNLKQLIQSRQQQLANVELVMELGRYIVGEAGYYVCEVVDKKVSRGTTFLVVNGGLHHHLANSGNFGQVIRRNFPVFIGNRMNEALTEEVDIVGPLCTPLDIVAKGIRVPKTEVGDFVVVAQSGAYGLSASPQSFLSHPGAGEILL